MPIRSKDRLIFWVASPVRWYGGTTHSHLEMLNKGLIVPCSGRQWHRRRW